MICKSKCAWLSFLLTLALTKATPNVSNEKSETNVMEIPCPPEEVIAPCICTVNPDYKHIGMDIDCSDAMSNEELAQSFSSHLAFPDFRELTIQYNRNLTTLKSGCFGEATFTDVSIHHGVLQTVEDNVFLNSMHTLNTLSIYHTQLVEFPFHELDVYKNLTILALNNNSFESYPKIISPTITLLNLDSNSITTIPADAFTDLPAIQTFDCTDCELVDVLAVAGESSYLSAVTLDHNDISYLKQNTFGLHGTDSFLSLSDNNITIIEEGAISGVTGVLDLSNNNIDELFPEIFQPIMDSAYLMNFDNNPLLCGCDLAWIVVSEDYMAKLNGNEMCQNGQLVKELDPKIYEELCF